MGSDGQSDGPVVGHEALDWIHWREGARPGWIAGVRVLRKTGEQVVAGVELFDCPQGLAAIATPDVECAGFSEHAQLVAGKVGAVEEVTQIGEGGTGALGQHEVGVGTLEPINAKKPEPDPVGIDDGAVSYTHLELPTTHSL